MTALPLVETTEGDIAAYIPTNLISITDGQVYLDAVRFERNERPAVDVGRSVSRIGAVAQPPLLRAVARNLRVRLSRAESMESLTRVGLEMDPSMQETLRRGHLLAELLRQPRLARRDLAEQAVALVAVGEDWLQGLEPAQARPWLAETLDRARAAAPALLASLARGEEPPRDWKETLAPLAREVRDRRRAARP